MDITLTGRQAYIARKLVFAAVGGTAESWARVRMEVSGYHGPRAGTVEPGEVDETLRLLMLADPADQAAR